MGILTDTIKQLTPSEGVDQGQTLGEAAGAGLRSGALGMGSRS